MSMPEENTPQIPTADTEEGKIVEQTGLESSDDDPDHDEMQAGDGLDTPGAGSSSQSKKRKKKKRSKAAKLLNSLKPGQKDIPQVLVDRMVDVVREKHGEDAPEADEEHVRKALESLKVMDLIKGKAGIAGQGKKDLGTHKVFNHCAPL